MISKLNQYKTIHDAVKDGNVGALEEMVKEGASVNVIENTKFKFCPLHWACIKGALECLHWLLWHNADPSVKSAKGWTSLHVVAIKGRDLCAQALIKNGADIFARDIRQSTPGHLAVVHGHTGVLHTLLRAGTDANLTDKNQWTLVHCAAYHGRLGCLQLLIRWGGSVDEVDDAGNTPAHLASMSGHLPCLKFIMGEQKNKWSHCLKERNNNGETALMLAHNYNKVDIIEYIKNLLWEAEHPEEAKNMSFPAHLAAYTGDITHLVMLIDNQVVNIDERDDNGSTPLHKAAGQGHLNVLQWLIEHGADTNIKNKAGETAADVARRFAQLPALQMLGGSDGDDDAIPSSDDDEAEDDLENRARTKSSRKSTKRNKKTGRSTDDGDDDDGGERNSKKARARAKNILIEMERKFEIAKANYIQLGGVVEGAVDERVSEVESYRRQLNELKRQLDDERAERMELNERMDEYKDEIIRLTCELQQVLRDKEEVDEMLNRKMMIRTDKLVKKKK